MKVRALLASLSLLVIFLASPFGILLAQTPEEKLLEIQKQKAEVEEQLSRIQGEKKTLKSQLNFIDTQTKLTQLKVEEATAQIARLEREILDLSSRITRLSATVDSLTEVLLTRIIQTYKYGSFSTIDLLFSSRGFSDLLTRIKYIQTAQTNDKKVLYQLQATKATYNDQRQDKETRQNQQEKLKGDLERYQVQLTEQKNAKTQLLNAVQNDESKYQARLRELEREISQTQQAAKILISTEPRKVGKGEVIGLMGNTGYSFGAHLHFGVYNISSLAQYNYYSNYENPNSVLRNTTVKWWEAPNCSESQGAYVDKSVGGGSWDWPMDLGNLKVSQGFGDTCYSGRLYGGRPHPAWDMFNNINVFVRSVDEGNAYFCRNCLGDGGNGVFIFHPNGKMTLYWHLQ